MAYLSNRLLAEELKQRGICVAVQNYLKRMKPSVTNLAIKPLLTDLQKNNRMKFVVDQADKRHDRDRCLYKDKYDTIHLDETWI